MEPRALEEGGMDPDERIEKVPWTCQNLNYEVIV